MKHYRVASSLEKIKEITEYEETTPSLIGVIIPTGRLKRLNISMDTGLITEIDMEEKRSGKNRSEFLADAAKRILF